MIRSHKTPAVKALALTVLALGSAYSSPTYGQRASGKNAEANTATPGGQFSPKTGAMVLEAQTLLTNGQNEQAIIKLTQALSLPSLNAYETSVIYQMLGSAHYEQDRFAASITAFENALSAGGLNSKDKGSTELQIAQLMIVNEQYTEGAQRLENYLNRSGVAGDKYHEMLIQAWVQAKNYNRALPWARKLFDAAQSKERKHFDTLNFLYNSLNRPEQQTEIVMQMIERWPQDAELWDAWASLFSVAGKDENAFEVTRLRYLAGSMSNETDLLKVVQYYSYYDMPFQAGQILETEMNAGRIEKTEDTLEQLSSLWRQAREYARAIPVLEEATVNSIKPELHAQLGEALYNEGECTRAEVAFISAIDKGYDAGKAWMLVGTCRYEDVQKQEKLNCEMSVQDMESSPISKGRAATITAFENVPAQSRQRADAQKWISFVKAERVTFDKQCEFKIKIRIDECFKDITRAYKNQFIDGTFKLGDPTCQSHVAAYDKEHRSKNAG